MKLSMHWLTSFFRKETDQEKVTRLQREAIRLETEAAYAEAVFNLQKRITVAKKRIDATRPKSKGGGSGILDFVLRHKVIVGVVVLIVVAVVVSRSC